MLGAVEIEPVLGYNSFDVRRYREYLQFVQGEDKPLRPRTSIFGFPIVDTFPIRNVALLDLLGTRYLLQPGDCSVDREGEPAGCKSWRKIGTDQHPLAYSFLAGGVQKLPGYSAYENMDVLPRAFVVSHARPLAERSCVLDQLSVTDFRREVLLEEMAIEEDAPAGSCGGDMTPARITEYTPNRVIVEADISEPGFLVLTDVWFPGWSCTVDGNAAVLHRANFLFRAVHLPAGLHEVIFTFAPTSYRVGKWISGVSLLVMVLICLSRSTWIRKVRQIRAVF